jgi:uncharacterized protein (TIGR02001 family)
MLKKTLLAGLVATALAPGLAAAQQAPASPHTLTGNVGLFSQYIFRGLTQTNREPALQGGFDYSHSSGLYAGTWASNVSWLRDGGAYSAGGSGEFDFYGGFKGSFGKSDFTWDIGTLYYYYPGDANTAANALNIKANTWEVYGALGWKWLSAKYSYSVNDKTFGVRDSSGTWYLDFGLNVPLGDLSKPLDGFTLMAHYGIQKFRGTDPRNAVVGGVIQSNDTIYSYEDWKIGLSYALPQGFTIGAFYTDTSSADARGYGNVAEGGVYPRNIAKGTGTLFIQKTF